MTTKTPPRWMERLLLLALAPRHRETVTGDLLEEYREESSLEAGSKRIISHIREKRESKLKVVVIQKQLKTCLCKSLIMNRL